MLTLDGSVNILVCKVIDSLLTLTISNRRYELCKVNTDFQIETR